MGRRIRFRAVYELSMPCREALLRRTRRVLFALPERAAALALDQLLELPAQPIEAAAELRGAPFEPVEALRQRWPHLSGGDRLAPLGDAPQQVPQPFVHPVAGVDGGERRPLPALRLEPFLDRRPTRGEAGTERRVLVRSEPRPQELRLGLQEAERGADLARDVGLVAQGPRPQVPPLVGPLLRQLAAGFRLAAPQEVGAIGEEVRQTAQIALQQIDGVLLERRRVALNLVQRSLPRTAGAPSGTAPIEQRTDVQPLPLQGLELHQGAVAVGDALDEERQVRPLEAGLERRRLARLLRRRFSRRLERETVAFHQVLELAPAGGGELRGGRARSRARGHPAYPTSEPGP